MTTSVQVLDLKSAASSPGLLGGRPVVNKRNGVVTIKSARGLTINSTLRKDEWEELDRRVVMAAVPPLVILNYLVNRGLTRTLGGLGTMVAQYNRISEMTPANASLRGHASGEKDLVDVDLAGVPVPVIFKEFEIDERLLLSSRRLGDGLDVTNAAAAARVVAEKSEDMLINGDANINLNGATIYGLTNHPDINTGTAASYGGGDWGTDTNITPTIAGMISAAQLDGYYGPYALWASPVQFNQASMVFFSDGSGDTPRDRILRLAGIQSFEQSPQLADGEVLLVTLSDEVVQIATVPGFFPITNREWMTGDGMLNSFKVMSVYTPIVKSAAGGKSGIVLATSA